MKKSFLLLCAVVVLAQAMDNSPRSSGSLASPIERVKSRDSLADSDILESIEMVKKLELERKERQNRRRSSKERLATLQFNRSKSLNDIDDRQRDSDESETER